MTAAKIHDWIEEYCADLSAQGYRPTSIESYRRALARLVPQIAESQSAKELLRALGVLDLAPATRSFYLTIARGFDAWCVETGRRKTRRLGDRARVRLDRAAPRPLLADEERKLERVALHARDPRMRLLYALQRDAGLRIGEALRLTWRDVVLDKGKEGIRVVEPKGRAEAVVPLHQHSRCGLLARLRTARKAASGRGGSAVSPGVYVLPSVKGAFQPWKYGAASSAFGRICKTAGVEAHSHQLRHTCATAWLRAGLSPEVVRRLLRHSNMNLLQRYCELTNDDLRADLEEHPDRA